MVSEHQKRYLVISIFLNFDKNGQNQEISQILENFAIIWLSRKVVLNFTYWNF